LSQKDKGRGLYRILAGSRAAEIDRKAIADGIDSKKLMKNAGTGAAEEIVFDIIPKTRAYSFKFIYQLDSDALKTDFTESTENGPRCLTFFSSIYITHYLKNINIYHILILLQQKL